MTILGSIGESMQKFAEVTKAALKLDIDIFDDDLIRVAGTGLSKMKIGNKIQERGIVNRHIYKGIDRIIINHPGVEENCKGCGNYGNCIYKKAVYAAIKYNNKTVGAMGILAFDENQVQKLNENKFEMLAFVDQIAELIGNKIKDYLTTKTLKHEIMGGVNTIDFDSIIGENEAINLFKRKITKVARTNSTVLLIGETGTGKELFSRAIHAKSLRRDHPFIAINCGAIPENLIESELFGYEKGAFTGANKYGMHGKFYNANGGTILLDEVENTPLYMQQKLLRVLENREIERIGSSETIPIDVRIIVASNRNLEEMVVEGNFREDLFHRLNVITLNVPPLRNRGSDVLVLADYFIHKFNNILNRHVKGIEQKVIDLFLAYDWPGNVRELQNVIEYAMNMETDDLILYGSLPERIKSEKIKLSTLCEVERDYIKRALDRYGWSDEGKIIAANALGISRSTIYRKAKRYNLEN